MDDEAGIIERGWVKYPPDEIEIDASGRCIQQPSLVTSDREIIGNPDIPFWAALITRPNQFAKSGNPVHAIEAIIMSHDAGLYPPRDVIEWLVSSLRKWHEKGGRITMDQAMVIKSLGGGQTANATKEAIRKQFQEGLMDELNNLRFVFGLTIGAAAGLISVRLGETNFNKTIFPLPKYGTMTLVEMYREGKCSRLVSDAMKEKLRTISDEEKRKILIHYPRHAYGHLSKMKPYL